MSEVLIALEKFLMSIALWYLLLKACLFAYLYLPPLF